MKSIWVRLRDVRRTSPGLLRPLLGSVLLLAAACGDGGLGGAGNDASAAASPPRSTRQLPDGSGLPEARPSPFQVELRRREGSGSTLLRVTDQGVRYTSGTDPHQVTVSVAVEDATLDALYAALREHQLDAIDTVPDAEADADGTSIRMLAGQLRTSASRMGHFVPEPAQAEHYDACIEALKGFAPPLVDGGAQGATLAIEFDPSMAQRSASVELSVGTALQGVTPGAITTIAVGGPQTVTVQLRYGPPARQIELAVDLAVHDRVVVMVDPQSNEPQLVAKSG